ncbi:MAG: hypothetical protein ACYDER_18820 [Ktedonobacteraceae bacterium]
MNEKQDNDKKWKDSLLKSSLPLEQLVAEKLVGQYFWIAGEYPYIRPNEQSISTEFSIDLHAYNFINGGEDSDTSAILNFLVECKYSYPGIRWIFSPIESSMPLLSPPESGYLYHLTHQGKHRLYNFTTDFPTCTRGIELTQKDFDPNVISRGLNQLRYGMPNLISQERESIQRRRKKQNKSNLEMSFIGLILVTTAKLYILRTGQSLENYRSAQSLDEIASPTEALIVSQELGPGLLQYSRNILIPKFSALQSDTVTKARAEQEFANVIPRTSQIIVVHLDTLIPVVETIKIAVQTIVNAS